MTFPSGEKGKKGVRNHKLTWNLLKTMEKLWWMTTHWLDHLRRSLTHDHDGSKHSLCKSVVLVNPRKTTVKATNICPLKRSNTYTPYSPLKWPNGATMGSHNGLPDKNGQRWTKPQVLPRGVLIPASAKAWPTCGTSRRAVHGLSLSL